MSTDRVWRARRDQVVAAAAAKDWVRRPPELPVVAGHVIAGRFQRFAHRCTGPDCRVARVLEAQAARRGRRR